MSDADLIRRLVDVEPIGYDSEWGPTGCLWCEEATGYKPPFLHDPSCVWVAGWAALGEPLPRNHGVMPLPAVEVVEVAALT